MAGEERPDLADGDEVTLATHAHAHVTADANATDAPKPALQVIVLVCLSFRFIMTLSSVLLYFPMSRKVSVFYTCAVCSLPCATCDLRHATKFTPTSALDSDLRTSAEERFQHMIAALVWLSELQPEYRKEKKKFLVDACF